MEQRVSGLEDKVIWKRKHCKDKHKLGFDIKTEKCGWKQNDEVCG